MSTKLSDIQKQIARLNQAEAWDKYSALVAKSQPFWQQAIKRMAQLNDLDNKKTASYLQFAQNSFKLLDDWYYGRTTYIKARRNEIDSAISFIRNSAMLQNISSRPAAASARNLAGVLRILLYLALRDYPADHYPRLMTNGLLDLAAVKTLFPIDVSDVAAQFAGPGEAWVDNIDYATTHLQRCAKAFNLSSQLGQLNAQLDELWKNFDSPEPWEIPESAWQPQKDSLLAEVHYQGVREFHNR